MKSFIGRKGLFLSIVIVLHLQLLAQYDWRPKACLPAAGRNAHASFSVNGRAYIVCGIFTPTTTTNEVWMYDPTTNTWTKKRNYPTGARAGQCSFVINGVAYVGLGSPNNSNVYVNEFWRYNDATDTWTSIANFPGSARYFAMAFALNGKGYIGCGKGAGQNNDFYEYNPTTNTWTKMASFPGSPRQNGLGLAVGGYGYMGLGYSGSSLNDVYRYDATNDTWSPVATFGGTGRYGPAYFAINDTLYVAGGRDPYQDDCWRYNAGNNSWTQQKSFTCLGPPRAGCYGFSLNGYGYAFGGDYNGGQQFFNTLFQFGPDDPSFVEQSNILGPDQSFCGNFIKPLSTGSSCTKWSTGATGPEITVNALGTYWATYPDTCGMKSDTIHLTQGSSNNLNLGNDTSYCGSFTRILSTGDPTTVWSTGATGAQITVTTAGLYHATVTNICGTDHDSILIIQTGGPIVNLGNDTTLCTGQSLLLDATNTGSTYRWQDNSTNPTFNASTAGTYYVTATNTSCSATDTVRVSFASQQPVINLGSDTTYCGPFSRVLSTGNARTVWSTGVTAPQLIVTIPGIYSATLSNGCGNTVDSITIQQDVAPTVNLGNDTTLCTGQTLLLDATNPNSTYRWQDNSTSPTFNVSSAGTYRVTATNAGGCNTADSILVNYNSAPPLINLGNDTTYCSAFQRTLQGSTGTVWSTGITASQITINTSGIYWAVNTNNCGTNSDSILINQYTTPSLQLTGSGTICIGDSILLQASTDGANLQWNTGSTNNSLYATQPGTYRVEVWNNPACLNVDSVIIPPGTPPQFSFGGDTSICGNDGIILNIPLANVNYQWQDNSTDSFYHVTSTGTYSVTASNNCGFTTDQVSIEVLRDNCQLLIPTAFSPNGDGVNDLFHAFSYCPVQSYHIKVYNRWGQLVFETSSLRDGWDGYYKDVLQPLSVFVYQAEYYNYCEQKLKTVSGTVTLVK